MPRATGGGWLWPTAAMLVCGCATEGQFVKSGSVESFPAAVELDKTPFFPQSEDLCGPAALATILKQSGVEVGFEEARSAVYIPERRGSLQLEMVAAIRSHGRVPYRIDPSLPSLVAELHAGRPILVLQNLGVKIAPLWHYAVVVGYDPGEKHLVLRSGDTERHVVPEARFIRSWRRGDSWGVVALRPDELPVVADEGRYLKAVAALESTGQYNVALQAYEVALQRWPGSTLGMLGLGNTYYAKGDLANAERAYWDLLRNDPDHVIALNNLAQTLADQSCVSEAKTVIDAAFDVPNTSESLFASLVATRAVVSATPESVCRN